MTKQQWKWPYLSHVIYWKMSKSSLRMFIHDVISKHGNLTNFWGILNAPTTNTHINEAITHEILIVASQFLIPSTLPLETSFMFHNHHISRNYIICSHAIEHSLNYLQWIWNIGTMNKGKIVWNHTLLLHWMDCLIIFLCLLATTKPCKPCISSLRKCMIV